MSLTFTILCPSANVYGLREDVAVWEYMMRRVSVDGVRVMKPRVSDPKEPPVASDVQLHLEVPVYGRVPWSQVNWVVVNHEYWVDAYDAYVHAMDGFIFRDHDAAGKFRTRWEAKGWDVADRIWVMPWCTIWKKARAIRSTPAFVSLVGASPNKCAALKRLLPLWQVSDPPLTVYTVREDLARELQALNSCVQVIQRDMTVEEQRAILEEHSGHVVVSEAEAYGYAAAHSEAVGGFTIMNRLPVWEQDYADKEGVAWWEGDRSSLESAFEAFKGFQRAVVRVCSGEDRVRALEKQMKEVVRVWSSQVSDRKPKGIVHVPPILEIKDCPKITVVTPTFQRKRLMEIAFHNFLCTDYPRRKIEWVVVEDNDKSPHVMQTALAEFQQKVPDMKIRYVTLEGRRSVGEKRNVGVEQASNEIILFMDDDDHYPPTSFRRRVAWLQKGRMVGKGVRAACCTTIAMYDLMTGCSAVNVPPMDIPFSQRVSEATLTFYKSFWQERPFPQVSVGEGEGWLEGRSAEVLEIPPQQIIVAFSHQGNASSRKVPVSEPACFWGFPKEYLVFIHKLVGVDVA